MTHTLAICPRIVEGLYREALALSEDVRGTFSASGQMSGQLAPPARPTSGARTSSTDEDRIRIAYSRVGLATTTRMMHAIAWLLQHRAYFMGEIGAEQLRRHGRLAQDLRHAREGRADDETLLDAGITRLVARTRTFYARLERLDETWSLSREEAAAASAIERLRQRIEGRLAS
ncbi:DUF1465 family protein [Novosphingobium decolorationis]|uniref:DUF1465 family protein n=1 Tax=Novosphingobium decolorationis TaxID=2698673 RepID=A0ABX8E4H0_9SPHN|nr:DUF1465 family protein [Novosphingobium decolorationis]QVM83494.1 DUF1465 family protein [Novosphingobium decolorationis]